MHRIQKPREPAVRPAELAENVWRADPPAMFEFRVGSRVVCEAVEDRIVIDAIDSVERTAIEGLQPSKLAGGDRFVSGARSKRVVIQLAPLMRPFLLIEAKGRRKRRREVQILFHKRIKQP